MLGTPRFAQPTDFCTVSGAWEIAPRPPNFLRNDKTGEVKALSFSERELPYTGISRAKNRVLVLVLASPERLGEAIQRRVIRVSGLKEKLWGSTDFIA